MPAVQFFQLISGVVRAEPAIDEAARDAPIPAVFVDHTVHDAIDFCPHACPLQERITFSSARVQCARAVVIACVLPGVNARQLKRSELLRIKRHGRVFPRRIWCQVIDIVDGSTDLVAVLIVQREGDAHIGQLLT